MEKDQQKEQPKEGFSVTHIIELMRATKKTDPLFKPLKKLKNALQSIGLDNVSLTPTKKTVIFHFGLGNNLDLQFIYPLHPVGLLKEIEIIPGSSYCLAEFKTAEQAHQWCQSQLSKIGQNQLYYRQVQHQQLKRVIVVLFCRETFRKDKEMLNCSDCPRKYKEETIPGLFLVEEVISGKEEIELLEWIDGKEWSKLNNRRVQHYGFEFKYGRNQIDKEEQKGQLPQFFAKLLANLTNNIQQLKGLQFDQLTINDYFAGDGIPAHFDTHSPFEEVFIAVSMLSGIVMEFKKYDGEEKSVYMPPRSIVIFSGQGRYAWTHGIACRKADLIDGQIVGRARRLSLTFRKIRHTPCPCPYYFYCDSQGYDQSTMKKHNPLLLKYLSMKNDKILEDMRPLQIERRYVEEAYNGFGFDFHNKVIQEVKAYIQEEIKQGQIILDIGCGNGEYGKYMPQGAYYLPTEKCRAMSQIDNLLWMEGRRLCARTCSVDRVLLVAMLHHMASVQSRLQVLKQCERVLKPGGVLYLSVLDYENKKNIYDRPDILLEYCLPTNKVPEDTTSRQQMKVQQPRKEERGQVYQRYYHLFTTQEIENLLQDSHFVVEQIVSKAQNILCRARKAAEHEKPGQLQ